MIERLKITKWVYWISVVLFINALLSLLTFVFPNHVFLDYFGILVIYCVFVSPLLIFMLFIDLFRDKYSNQKIRLISLLINLGVILLAYYYGDLVISGFLSF